MNNEQLKRMILKILDGLDGRRLRILYFFARKLR